MKYYIIYEIYNCTDSKYESVKILFIVEHREVAADFCKKHFGCYYEEVIIGD